MNICIIFNIYIKLLLMFITFINVSQQTNASVLKSNANTYNNVSGLAEGGGNLGVLPVNAKIIPGPNLESAISNIKQQQHNESTVIKKQDLLNTSTIVASEGGGKTNTKPMLNQTVPFVEHNRSTENRTSIPLSTNRSNTNIPMEGGGKPLLKGSVNNHPSIQLVPKKTDTTTPPQRIIPVIEESSRQKIAPRKGVNYAEFKLDNNTAKVIVKKPLVTEASEDEIPNEENSKSNVSIPVESQSKVPSLDRFNEFSNKTQKYVVPIVIVILSVPLVTIVISFLLKRGAEWWKYRHYRRMDFLINGIYDT